MLKVGVAPMRSSPLSAAEPLRNSFRPWSTSRSALAA